MLTSALFWVRITKQILPISIDRRPTVYLSVCLAVNIIRRSDFSSWYVSNTVPVHRFLWFRSLSSSTSRICNTLPFHKPVFVNSIIVHQVEPHDLHTSVTLNAILQLLLLLMMMITITIIIIIIIIIKQPWSTNFDSNEWIVGFFIFAECQLLTDIIR